MFELIGLILAALLVGGITIGLALLLERLAVSGLVKHKFHARMISLILSALLIAICWAVVWRIVPRVIEPWPMLLLNMTVIFGFSLIMGLLLHFGTLRRLQFQKPRPSEIDIFG